MNQPNNNDLNRDGLHVWSNVVDFSVNGWRVIARTIAGNGNIRRPKLASGNKMTHVKDKLKETNIRTTMDSSRTILKGQQEMDVQKCNHKTYSTATQTQMIYSKLHRIRQYYGHLHGHFKWYEARHKHLTMHNYVNADERKILKLAVITVCVLA